MVGVVLPSGEKHEVALIKTVTEVLQELKGSRAAECDLVFYGEKLEHNVRLSDVKQLNNSGHVYLVGKDEQQSSFANLEEIDKELASCKMLMKTISAEEEKKIYEYCSNYGNLRKILAESPMLYADQLAFDLLHDFRLLTEFLFNKENFARERPHCLKVYRKVVETAVSRPSPVAGNMFAQNLFAQPSSSANAPITNDMLQQALANVFTGMGIPPVPQNTGNSSSVTDNSASQGVQQEPIDQAQPAEPMEVDYNHLRQNYQVQLEQMREFGFTNDEENLRALQACDGVVEAALELVISMRE